MTTVMQNINETVIGQIAPDLVEDPSCISFQSEAYQMSNLASSSHTDDNCLNGRILPISNQTEFKESDNMNCPKNNEIHRNNMLETESAEESSFQPTDMETMVLSKKGLCISSVEIQKLKLHCESNKEVLADKDDSNSLESKDNLVKSYTRSMQQHCSSIENTGVGVLRHDSAERLKKVTRTEADGTQRTNSHIAGSSTLNWFPRKRTESYLERKIRMLQEVEGMNTTLDETLGGANPHLSRIEREKLAAQAAAVAAMEARKAALVEAAWCRILKAARIPCALAEVQLQNSEKKAAEAFDAAAALGVVISNKPGGPKQSLEVETSIANGSQTHTVSASLATPFEVDKEVAGAVKVAFFRLAHLPASSIKDIFDVNDDTCRRVSIKPDKKGTALYNDSFGFGGISSEASSESEAQAEGEQETDSKLEKDADVTVPHANCVQIAKEVAKKAFCKHRNHAKRPQSKQEPANEVKISEDLIDLMLERVKLLKEEELVSLAMIVATRGLSAMLEEENKEQQLDSKCNSGGLEAILVKHISRLEAEKAAAAASKAVEPQNLKKKTPTENLPDLGSILVKHVSKLEREVQEARKMTKAMHSEDQKYNGGFQEHVESLLGDTKELGSLLVQDAFNSEKVPATELVKSLQTEEQRSMCRSERESLAVEGENNTKQSQPNAGLSIRQSMETNIDLLVDGDDYKENRDMNTTATTSNVFSANTTNLDILNPENTNNLDEIQISNFTSKECMRRARQQHYNENHEEGLDKVLVKHVSRLEKEKQTALTPERESSQRVQRNQYQYESLDKVLVKHISKLEKEKIAAAQGAASHGVQENKQHYNENHQEGLDKVLVKHVSRLEKEKQEALTSERESSQRLQRNQCECESLDKVLVKNISKLEKAKMEAAQEASHSVKKSQKQDDVKTEEGLGQILIKHVSKLEREKREAVQEAFQRVQRKQHPHDENSWGSLDKVLVKHFSRLEKEKLRSSPKGTSQEYEKASAAVSFSQDAAGNNSIIQRQRNARAQEIQLAWGGVNLGNSLRPHLTKLELDKAAWLQAEEEELKRTSQYR